MNKSYKHFLFFVFSIFYPYIMYIILETFIKNVSIPINAFIMVTDILFILIIYFIYKKDIILEWNIFKKDWINIIKNNARYWGYGLIAMSFFNLLITFFIAKDISENEKLVRELLEQMPIFMIISTVIVAPITEEMIYRKSIKGFINNKYFYMVMSGLIFGLAHVINSFKDVTDFLFILPYGALGFVFAYIYDKTKTIFAPISFHLIHNLIMVTLSMLLSLIG
ncbi:MAG: type II CAAX endopeptidase family protein [Bacilli bacterium]|nr:type II CAAX endopeptidase family protein [Bacilli bacterium]